MARIAYILLCHKDPEGIIQQANRLTAVGDYISIHFDARAKKEHFDQIYDALKDNDGVVFANKRVKCGWGEWSLVEATLHALEAAEEAFPRATHFYMLSGDCMPIKSAKYAHEFLDRRDVDYIESFDFFASDWIKTGIKEDRLIYRHFFNERNHKNLFYLSLQAQRKLHLSRKIPADLQMMIGSQWWCLRRRTVEAVLDFSKRRKDVVRFFKTTWIPDETYFQTVVRHLVPEDQIDTRTLTFLIFSDYGMPVNFYNDQYDLLLSQDFLFARKISVEAQELKRRLGALYASEDATFNISNEGRSLFRFLSGRGRIGRRYAPRFWEKEASLGPDRELLIITCKKWHVAKRLLHAIKDKTGMPGVEYIFNEDGPELPDLGGIQRTLEKRTRHRRALMRMLFDYYDTNRLIICMDPSNIDLMQDFYSDRCMTKLLEIQTEFSDDYLIGHAKRVGIAGENTPDETIERMLPTIRFDVAFDSDRLRDEGFSGFHRIAERNSVDENTDVLSAFLALNPDAARDIMSIDYLFVD